MNKEDAAKKGDLKRYRVFFRVTVCAAGEREAMIKGFDYLAAFYGDPETDVEGRSERSQCTAVYFERAELISEATE